MSIPDDPFTQDSVRSPTGGIVRENAPPTLQIDTGSPEVDTTTSPQAIDFPRSPARAHEARVSADSSSPQSPPGSTPGGTLGLPTPGGTRPARRVQWTSDSHIVSMHEIETLDSNTVDANNLRHLDTALERHRSRSSGRRRPPSMLSSHASSAGDELTDGEDYDYRLDVDPPNLRPVTSAGSQTAPEQGSLQQLLGNDINQHVTEYIPLGEVDGLPNLQNAHNTDRDAAKDLVRAHTGKWGTLRRRVRGAGLTQGALGRRGSGVDPEKEDSARQEAFAARYPEPGRPGHEDHDDDDEDRHARHQPGMNAMPQIPGGASVLSSLLALYGQQNEPDSGPTSAASSRPTSDDEDSSEDERRRVAAINATRKPSLFQRKASVPDVDVPPERQPLETKPAHEFALGMHHRSKSTTSLADRMERREADKGFFSVFRRAKEQIEDLDRPEAARSGAGVFGALMQNTANLSGVATPAASALTPAARRPGYQLNRFSLPELEAPVRPKNWRPPSRPGSRSGSRPASVHSSTAVSTGSREEDSPNDKKLRLSKTMSSRSSDDIVSMKEKKTPKTLTLDSLHKLPGAALKEGAHTIRNAEKWIMSGGKTPLLTPPEKALTDYFTRPLTEDEMRRREREKAKKKRKKAKEARKKQEIYVSDA